MEKDRQEYDKNKVRKVYEKSVENREKSRR